MSGRIAIVGMACRYPDARSPVELWENALSQRRAFRRLPDERMRLEDYWSADPAAPDRFYSSKAAVIEGYEFDRMRHRIPGSTYRSTDLTHWLALDVAGDALTDAGFAEAEGVPKARTGVVVGNSLTGEFSRANLMRVRWPYVRRTVAAALRAEGWPDEKLTPFLGGLEENYKSAFPPVDEDTLAGGLANTIAGRICNYFDFGGGGYTVDGACSSSLLSLSTACGALQSGEIDLAIAGGVDLSIDPFEIVGFAKTGALATADMRVYDRGSNGFWPGEGAGMVVLMREPDAVASGKRVYATVRGWGISSDGAGGITRPEAEGYRRALADAYRKAGFDLGTIDYFEGHGTGTPVGDATELHALATARRAADRSAPVAAIGTIKGNIGHTKAAAGVAGLIKATMAVHHRVLPPTTGCFDPHDELVNGAGAGVLRVLERGEPWPEGRPVRAGVTSMGFGGINTHVVLEGADGTTGETIPPERTRTLLASAQDCELLLLDADSVSGLREQVVDATGVVAKLAFAELGDFAVALQGRLSDAPVRAAIVASSPEQAELRLSRLLDLIDQRVQGVVDVDNGVFFGRTKGAPRVGFLFPGQGSGKGADAPALRRRFSSVDELFATANLPQDGDQVETAVAQPRIVTGSLAGMRTLARFGLVADTAVGHSLGELTALHWANAFDEPTLLRLATARGRAMSELSESDGAMGGIGAGAATVEELLVGEPVVVAGLNGSAQTVVAGPAAAVERVGGKAQRDGLQYVRLPVSHAFHSPLVEPAAQALSARLADETVRPLSRTVVSTVLGRPIEAGTDLRALLRDQVTLPVRFGEALEHAAVDADLLIEVGPGRVLTVMASAIVDCPVVALQTDGRSLSGLWGALGAAYVLGASIDHGALVENRFSRPLPEGDRFRFFSSPCESAPDLDVGADLVPAPGREAESAQTPAQDVNALEVLRRLVAERVELPAAAVGDQILLLDELHLSSITVGQIMNKAASELGLSAPAAPTVAATSSLRELAQSLDDLARTSRPEDTAGESVVGGVAPWVRAFSVEWVPARPAVSQPAMSEARSEPSVSKVGGEPGAWQLFTSGDYEPADTLRDALTEAGLPAGVLVALPDDAGEESVRTLLDAARAALSGAACFAVVQSGRTASALAKTLHLEAPAIATVVVDVALNPDTIPRVVEEIGSTTAGFKEVRIATDGTASVPVLRALTPTAPRATGAAAEQSPVGPHDVVLVTGGGKGITAECALELAQATGARVGLLGRSAPQDDTELADNLERMRAAGVGFCYVRADIGDAVAVGAAVAEVTAELGPITGILHGAGRNVPSALASLSEQDFRDALAPKIDGLRRVLDAVDTQALRLFITFGSIIGRAGLRGEAHYATANAWLTDLTLEFADTHPDCKCLALEWSVWSGVGMGERLGVVESLTRDGITPISTDEGLAMFRWAVADPSVPPVLVVTGRVDGLPTVTVERPELPLLRFVDQPLVHYPGIELVAAVELTESVDSYLEDHLLDGDLLFPAVIGMEAMTQVAVAARGANGLPDQENLILEDLEFLQPVVVPPGGKTEVRVAALVRETDVVDVVIRSADTGFQVDHFRATCRFGAAAQEDVAPAGKPAAPDPVRLDPARELYGGVFFQGKRFRRVVGYRELAARSCVVDIAGTDVASWFGPFTPHDLLIGDPGIRDAFMHGIQVCVPHATLLPAGVERIWVSGDRGLSGGDRLTMRAEERLREGDTFTYDLSVYDGSGRLTERWDGLRLQAVRKTDGSGPWVAPLLGPYLQRELEDLLPGSSASIAVDGVHDEPGERANGRGRTRSTLGRALGRAVAPRYRPDGKPEIEGETPVSASRCAHLTMAASGPDVGGCDVEEVVSRPVDDWRGLLGRERFGLAELAARSTGEEFDLAATRVWAALECGVKAGRLAAEPLTLGSPSTDGWVVFAVGSTRIATFVTRLREVTEPVVFAVRLDDRSTR